MDSRLASLVSVRRRRLVASIMGHAERAFYDQLTEEQQNDFREKVLQSVDDFADLMRDMLRVAGDDVVLNAHVIELLDRIHQNTRR